MRQQTAIQTQNQTKATPLIRGGILQRQYACGQHTGSGGECTECRKKRLSLQRRVTNQAEPTTVPPIVHDVLRSPGQPLDLVTRAFMQPRFGHDFSQVRVHTDVKAAESARAVNALAYTVSHNIVFDSGRYAPATNSGRKLLAHELTHVLQQSQRVVDSSTGVKIALTDDLKYEQDASEAEQRVMLGGTPTRITPYSDKPRLHRQKVTPRAEQKPTETKPKIKYMMAERENKKWAEPDSLGWGTKLETVAEGAYKVWANLWKTGEYNPFADAVAAYQLSIGITGKSVDGVLGPQTWSRIGGLGEAVAGITRVIRSRSDEVCTLATKERIERGFKLATGNKFSLPEDKDKTTFKIILQTIEGRMLDIDKQYRGTGAAGAMVYAGLGAFVQESDIWSGGLRSGAAMQVWYDKKAYNLLRVGEVEEKDGKKRPINHTDANFFGTSFVFVRYDTENPERVLVRHFGRSEWMEKSDYEVWIAANVDASSKSLEGSNE